MPMRSLVCIGCHSTFSEYFAQGMRQAAVVYCAQCKVKKHRESPPLKIDQFIHKPLMRRFEVHTAFKCRYCFGYSQDGEVWGHLKCKHYYHQDCLNFLFKEIALLEKGGHTLQTQKLRKCRAYGCSVFLNEVEYFKVSIKAQPHLLHHLPSLDSAASEYTEYECTYCNGRGNGGFGYLLICGHPYHIACLAALMKAQGGMQYQCLGCDTEFISQDFRLHN